MPTSSLLLLALLVLVPFQPLPGAVLAPPAEPPAAAPVAWPAAGGIVGADGALQPLAGWRVALSPTLEAGLVGPGRAWRQAPWSAVAEQGGRRCLVRTEARDARAVYVTVRIESETGLARTSLLRWDVSTGRWSDVRPL